MKTFHIKTLGCKVNQYESEQIRQLLLGAGLKEACVCDADLKIVNSCSVTSTADSKTRQEVNKALKGGKEVIITGCAVENPSSGITGAKVIVNKDKIGYFERLLGSRKAVGTKKSRPLVQIQDGCPQRCSYCIVPSLRGNKSVSKDFEDAVEEIMGLVSRGFKEIVLTGINTGLYSSNGKKLAGLINELNQSEKEFRIRFSSLELNTIDDGFISAAFAPDSKVVNHIHIPLQSGSKKVLKDMKRPYTPEIFINRIKDLKTMVPNLAVTTDCIVGFPSEEEKYFDETCDVVKKCGFAKVHIFKYSKRPGTPASEMKGIDPEIVKRRSKDLQLIADGLRKDFIASQTGKVRQVLCEKDCSEYLTGLSDNYIRVNFKGSSDLLRKLARVKILNAQESGINARLEE